MPQNSQALDLEEALTRLTARLARTSEVQRLPLDAALGRVLAASCYAPVDMPPFPASAMDGYAVRAEDFQASRSFTRVGESRAGHPFGGRVGAGQCVRIFTGAAVPDGATQVLLQEEVAGVDGDRVDFRDHQPGESYIRARGHDVARGAEVASAGAIITPFQFGAMRAYGISTVDVTRRLRVGVFSTGDELVDADVPAHALGPGQIYDSNRASILKLLDEPVFELTDLGRLPDLQDTTNAMLADSSSNFDVLVTSGGVSVGEHDFVTGAIRALGELDFWRLNLKPGKPMAVGRIGNCTLFGLPGNPVSTVVTLLLVARPAMWFMAGAEPRRPLRLPARADSTLHHAPGRTEFQRGTLNQGKEGLMVSHTGDQSSNRLSTLAAANCLIEIPKETGDVAVGDWVQVIPMAELFSVY